MKNFNRDRGGRNFGNRSFGGRGDDRHEMHHAVCSECGKDCEVPFRPSGSKPVYCSQCFDKQGSSSRDSGPRRDFGGGGRNFGSSRDSHRSGAMHHAVCSDCGKDCEVPFRPTGDKPIYCNNCFGKNGKDSPVKRKDNFDVQFESLNKKLDRILEVLIPKVIRRPEENQVVKKQTENKKEVEKVAKQKPAVKKEAKKKVVKKNLSQKKPAKKKVSKKK